MKENFLHLTSEVDCIVGINGKTIGTIEPPYLHELNIITKTKNVFITYEPISKKANALPYTFLLNSENTPSTNNEYIKIVPFPNNNYDIIMKPFYYYQISQSKVLFNGNVGKYFVSIISDTITRITIFSGASIIFNTNIPTLIDARVQQRKNFLIIEGVIDESTYHLLIVNTDDFSIIHNDTSHSIEETSDYVCSLKNMNTLCKHARVWKLVYSDNTKEEYFVYNDEKNKNIHSLLIPQAFLECVAIGDEHKAKSFLSNNYQNSSINQLQGYFGNINSIHFNRHNVIPAKLNYTINSSTMKNYNFIMDGNTITDIEDVF